MAVIAAVVAAVVLAGLAVLQVLVAAGHPYGALVWGGQHRVLPRRLRIASAVSVPLYVLFAGVLGSRAGLFPGGDGTPVVVGAWVLVGYFCLGVGLNAISRSRTERLVMVPACLVLGIASLVVAIA